jgi:hypothetical protein
VEEAAFERWPSMHSGPPQKPHGHPAGPSFTPATNTDQSASPPSGRTVTTPLPGATIDQISTRQQIRPERLPKSHRHGHNHQHLDSRRAAALQRLGGNDSIWRILPPRAALREVVQGPLGPRRGITPLQDLARGPRGPRAVSGAAEVPHQKRQHCLFAESCYPGPASADISRVARSCPRGQKKAACIHNLRHH